MCIIALVPVGCSTAPHSDVIVWGDVSALGASIIIDGHMQVRASEQWRFEKGLRASADGFDADSAVRVQLVAPGRIGTTARPFSVPRGVHSVLVVSPSRDTLATRGEFGEYAAIVVSFSRRFVALESNGEIRSYRRQ